MEPSDIVYSTETLNFIQTARDFCKWVEEAGPHARKSAIESGMRIVPLLYSQMTTIPESDPYFEEGNERFVTEQDWSEIYQRFSVLLGSMNEYTDAAAIEEYDRSETVLRYVSEDIADIYQDIKDCIENYVIGTEEVMHDALWECRSGFISHWGEKALRLAMQLHRIYFSAELSEMEDLFHSDQMKDSEINTENWFLSKRQKEFRDDNYDLSE